MSVIVEAMCLVVPRRILNIQFPGGAAGFVERLCEVMPGLARDEDGELVSIALENPAQANRIATILSDQGLVATRDGAFADFAFVDRELGPTLPCPWLRLDVDLLGTTLTWSGEVTPDLLHLATERGMAHTLDLTTGAVMARPARPADRRSTMEPPNRILAIVEAALAERDTQAHRVDADRVRFSLRADHAAYQFIIWTDPELDIVGCTCLLASAVPEDRRTAMAVALCMINDYLRLGNFEMDFATGQMRFRLGADIEGAELTHAMVTNMVSGSLHTCESYHDALMRIAFGGADPAIVKEIEL